MSEDLVFPVPDQVAADAWVDNDKYLEMYQASVDDSESFWSEQGKRIDWIKPYAQVKDVDFADNARIKWFYDGTLNASFNCLDRHLDTRGDQTAIIWEGESGNSMTYTFGELSDKVNQL
ncbi:MAG: acetyl-coenzyme A synthetase N-terminal domain-containing protein, partial [Rhodospirillales bacterium]|nr:acetyl-coenzyme A synthetase N-terminal domain-containing protein [Rhodospirillales bacterium]